jgi:hypothetical protein
MIISPRETAQREVRGAARGGAPYEAAIGSTDPNRLNPDEWEFLRATPDFDAEEMASVALREPASGLVSGWDAVPAPAPRSVQPSLETESEFPEVGALAEMLDDLLGTTRGGTVESAAQDTTWADVPAAKEWASLMAPQGDAGASPVPSDCQQPAAPAVRDVLMDALTASERIGLLPGKEV